jgi:hypothetical protein
MIFQRVDISLIDIKAESNRSLSLPTTAVLLQLFVLLIIALHRDTTIRTCQLRHPKLKLEHIRWCLIASSDPFCAI